MASTTFAVTSSDYTVTYKNQLGSTLILTWHPEKNTSAGSVSGMLTSNNGSCRQSANVPAAVSGVFMGNAVAMTLSYPKCDKVAAIVGNLNNNKTELHTMWLISSHSKDFIRDGNGNQVSSDIYIKIAS